MEKRGLRDDASDEAALGTGQVIRLRFMFQRIPYEIDCQIIDRFHPTRLRNVDLTPRVGVGYEVRPLTDVRNRNQRRYIRYTHKVGYGHLRMRNEIQFQVYAHRTNFEIPEKGVLQQTLTFEDFQTFPYGNQEVPETKDSERLEDVVEFFMTCMVNNPTERRQVYISKACMDQMNRTSLIGLGYYNTVGAQQTAILPKIFVKKPPKGKSMLERQLAQKGKGAMDSRRLRVIEEIHDRYQLLTRELKIWQQKKRGKSGAGDFENDRPVIGFSLGYGLSADDPYSMRQMLMPCEVTDIGVENITLKPVPFEDARSRELESREFVRQEEGFQLELLNFGVGGVEIRGGETHEQNEAFLKYLVGEDYDTMNFLERVEALRRFALVLHFYPVLNFVRSQIQAMVRSVLSG